MPGIVLVGEPGSGKSSIAESLVWQLGKDWCQLSFATALKDEVARSLALNKADNDPKLIEAWYLSIRMQMTQPETKDRYRGILQWWGTEWRRADDPNYWVDRLLAQINGDNYVIDDCRFDNEWKALRARGFRLVYLRPGETTRPVQSHASEVDWKEWEPDLVLSYERGPAHQALRIIKALQEQVS